MSIIAKIKDWVSKNPDKANSAIDKVGDLVDKRTQGKYAQQVDKVQDAAKKNLTGGAGAPPAQQPPAQQPLAQQPPAQQPPAGPTSPQ
jgi:hypothetical protein